MAFTPPRSATAAAIALFGGVLISVSPAPAHAGVFDALFGSEASSRPSGATGRREWNLGDYTAIRLVPREAGSPANEQPAEIAPDVLRRLLEQVRIDDKPGAPSLFSTAELAELLEPLSQAFASARPDDDVLLLSTARRGGLLTPQTAITARLFIQGGKLQLVVHDTRFEFMNELRGGRIEPKFVFGSRRQTSGAVLRSPVAEQKRADWVALGLTDGASGATAAPRPPAAPVAPAAAAPASPAAPAAPAAPNAPAAAAPLATPPAAPAAVAPASDGRARDARFYDEQEQRLKGLKRLRDQGLLSEEEYQQKRKEILQAL